eukprot:3919771-Rhodomonas_salina.1
MRHTDCGSNLACTCAAIASNIAATRSLSPVSDTRSSTFPTPLSLGFAMLPTLGPMTHAPIKASPRSTHSSLRLSSLRIRIHELTSAPGGNASRGVWWISG